MTASDVRCSLAHRCSELLSAETVPFVVIKYSIIAVFGPRSRLTFNEDWLRTLRGRLAGEDPWVLYGVLVAFRTSPLRHSCRYQGRNRTLRAGLEMANWLNSFYLL